MLYRITLGDWLGKGHDIRRDYLFECNRSVAEIAAAYEISCEKYGIRFDDSGRAGLSVWYGYGEDGMGWTAYDILTRAGILDDGEAFKGSDGLYRVRDAAGLVMRFIALSMPADFTYEPVEIPSLNNSIKANVGFGLFEGTSC